MKIRAIYVLLLVALASCATQERQPITSSQSSTTLYINGGGNVVTAVATPNREKYWLTFAGPGFSCNGNFESSVHFSKIGCTNGSTAEVSISVVGLDMIGSIKMPNGAYASVTSVPAYSPSNNDYSGCRDSNYYGAISCETNRAKTTHVRGYYRKNGTYVQPHWRS